MKYWFYFYDNMLYAYTDQADYRKMFEQYRDMSKFKVVRREVDNNELKELHLNYNQNILVSYHFKVNKNTYSKLIITKEEQLYTINTSTRLSTVGIFDHCWTNPNIFNKEIREALDSLKYSQCHSVISSRNSKYFIDDDIGVDDCDIDVDEFAIFMNMYGDTFKDKY